MSKRGKTLLQILQQRFPQDSKEKLYALILSGQVTANGHLEKNPKRVYPPNISIHFAETTSQYVSRAAFKLEAALKHFQINVADWVCVDAGASTGGFSDCLLQHGAKLVYAVESGTNQLHYKIRRHPQVISRENTRIQDFIAEFSAGPISDLPDFIVMDLSFRSILGVLQPGLAITKRKSGIILCKPQFEWVGFQQQYNRTEEFDGILNDSLGWEVCQWICSEIRKQKMRIEGICASPIRGSGGKNRLLGNLEYLLYVEL